MLKQGVADWNAWREKNPDIRPDLNPAHPSTAHMATNSAIMAQGVGCGEESCGGLDGGDRGGQEVRVGVQSADGEAEESLRLQPQSCRKLSR